MARRRSAPVRNIIPDPLFHSVTLAKFINCLMEHGKKSVAQRIVYGALDKVVQSQNNNTRKISNNESETNSSGSHTKRTQVLGSIHTDAQARVLALKLFQDALSALKPAVEVKSRRVGGATYQVPVEVRAGRQMALSMRWLVEYAKKRDEQTMILRLSSEIMDALNSRGGSFKKKEDVHRMAHANRAFAHYRW